MNWKYNDVFTNSDADLLDDDEVFVQIMERLLSRVPQDIDSREGSVIYNALAPAAWEIQLFYEELRIALQEGFADTASLYYLSRRAKERGIIHKEATRAVVKGKFEPQTIDVTNGRFTELKTGLSYIVTTKIEPGVYELECETSGEEGNLTTGQLITDEVFDDTQELTLAQIIGLSNAAADEEDVEVFRKRYFDSIDSQAFGGNIADYKAKVLSSQKVGGVKVYPVWNGGGTVKIVFLNNAFASPGTSVVNEIQTIIDPEQNHGEGKGIAPIGHVVTVEAAESVLINIVAQITYTEGHSLATATASMKAAVEEYFLTVRKEWGNTDCKTGSVVRISYIENKLLNLPEVLDIQVTTINGSSANLQLAPNQVPVVGGIVDGISRA